MDVIWGVPAERFRKLVSIKGFNAVAIGFVGCDCRVVGIDIRVEALS